jgi:hypothetical protein
MLFIILVHEIKTDILLFVFWRDGPQRGRASSFTRFLDHTQRPTTVVRTPLDEFSSSQRPLPDNTQLSQQTNIHARGGIRSHSLNRRAAADLRLSPRGHWDRQYFIRQMKHLRDLRLSQGCYWSLKFSGTWRRVVCWVVHGDSKHSIAFYLEWSHLVNQTCWPCSSRQYDTPKSSDLLPKNKASHPESTVYEGGSKNNRNLNVARELEVVARCAARHRESTPYSSSLPRGVSLGWVLLLLLPFF